MEQTKCVNSSFIADMAPQQDEQDMQDEQAEPAEHMEQYEQDAPKNFCCTFGRKDYQFQAEGGSSDLQKLLVHTSQDMPHELVVNEPLEMHNNLTDMTPPEQDNATGDFQAGQEICERQKQKRKGEKEDKLNSKGTKENTDKKDHKRKKDKNHNKDNKDNKDDKVDKDDNDDKNDKDDKDDKNDKDDKDDKDDTDNKDRKDVKDDKDDKDGKDDKDNKDNKDNKDKKDKKDKKNKKHERHKKHKEDKKDKGFHLEVEHGGAKERRDKSKRIKDKKHKTHKAGKHGGRDDDGNDGKRVVDDMFRDFNADEADGVMFLAGLSAELGLADGNELEACRNAHEEEDDSDLDLGSSSVSLLFQHLKALPEGSSARRHAIGKTAAKLGRALRMEDTNYFLRSLQKLLIERKVKPRTPYGKQKAAHQEPPHASIRKKATRKLSATNPTALHVQQMPPVDDQSSSVQQDAAIIKIKELCFSLQDRPLVCDGLIHEQNLRWFAAEVLAVAERAGHWDQAWLQMLAATPLTDGGKEKAGVVFVKALLDLMVEPPGRVEEVATALATLTRAHRLKFKTMEVALGEFSTDIEVAVQKCPEAWSILSWLLFHWYPRPKDAGWGWNRIGWSWREWWRQVERLLAGFPAKHAANALQRLLELVQLRGGGVDQGMGDAQLQEKIRWKLQELGFDPFDEDLDA